jgi:hypothetical protein
MPSCCPEPDIGSVVGAACVPTTEQISVHGIAVCGGDKARATLGASAASRIAKIAIQAVRRPVR